MKKLTPKEELFVIEYPKDFNATQAAIRAGYSPKTAAQQGSRLLIKVKDILAERKAEVMEKAGGRGIATLEQSLRLATARAFYDPAKMYDQHGNPREVTDIPKFHRYGIAGFEVEELYDGRGEDRKKIGYVKKYKLVDSAPYVAMLLKFHNAFPSNKQPNPSPKDVTPRFDPKNLTPEEWEQAKALLSKMQVRTIEHA